MIVRRGFPLEKLELDLDFNSN
jgi:hypothetical protein